MCFLSFFRTGPGVGAGPGAIRFSLPYHIINRAPAAILVTKRPAGVVKRPGALRRCGKAVSGLALSVTYGDSSPKGRANGGLRAAGAESGICVGSPFGGAAERSEAERVSLVTSEPQALRWDRSIKEMCPSLSVVTRAAASPSQSKPYGFASSPKGRANCGSRAAGAESRRCVASPFERLPPAGGRCRVSDKGRTRWHCVSNDGEGEAAARMQTSAARSKTA